MWTLLLSQLALAAPTTELCTQPALDAAAADENALWAALDMLEMSRVTHQLSEKTEIGYEGTTLRKGDRVRTRGRAGTFKPHSTGHVREVWITGQQGTIVCFTRSTSGSIKNELAVVRWDAQGWQEEIPERTSVALPVFAASIHPSYLVVEPAKAP